MNDKERHEGDSVCVSLDGNGTTIDVHADNMGSAGQSFSFDHVFGYDATQAEIYDVVGKSVVEGLFEGYNGTIFAYGQVGRCLVLASQLVVWAVWQPALGYFHRPPLARRTRWKARTLMTARREASFHAWSTHCFPRSNAPPAR